MQRDTQDTGASIVAGLTLKQRAELQGVSYSTIRRMAGGNIQTRYTEEQKDLVYSLAVQGLSDRAIAKHTNIPRSTINYWKKQWAL